MRAAHPGLIPAIMETFANHMGNTPNQIQTMKPEDADYMDEWIINVYNQQYESAAAFWPDVHGRIIVSLVISQVLLMGLLSTKEAAQSTPLLIVLPVLTIWFHRFCKVRFEPAFLRYPLQEAKMKDTLESTREPSLNLKECLQKAYIHPVFKSGEKEDDTVLEESEESSVVPTTRNSRRNTPAPSRFSGSSSPLLPDGMEKSC